MLVTVDTVVLLLDSRKKVDAKILLIKRGNDPYKGSYALPGGFPEMDELLVEAAKRELFEETGLSKIELVQLKTFDAIDRDPRGRNVSVVFLGITSPQNSNLIAGDDASEAGWFHINSLPNLAFDHHEVINYAIDWMKRNNIK